MGAPPGQPPDDIADRRRTDFPGRHRPSGKHFGLDVRILRAKHPVGRTLRYKLAVHPPRGRNVTLSAQRFVNGRWKTFRTVVRDANRVLTRTITARDTDKAVQVVVTVPRVRAGAEVYRAARIVKTIRR